MELRQLRYFVAVAEQANFNRAAERLHVAQPALSRQVGALETEMGVPLFERLPRGVRLTPAGSVFLDRARRILAEVESAREQAQEAQQGKVGTLRLGFSAIAVKNQVVPEALRRFRLARPHVQLDVHTLVSPEQVARLYNRTQDVGFLYMPPAAHPALRFVELAPYRMIIALPRRHRLAGRAVLRMADLAKEDFVWLAQARMPWIHDELLAECLGKGFSPRIVQQADDSEAMLALVSVDLGVAFIHPLQQAPMREVVYKEVVDLGLVWPLYMAWRRDETNPVVTSFVDLVIQIVGGRQAKTRTRLRPRPTPARSATNQSP
ncbi:MAG TPA: LysR substrate-binding domain-containing protein [Burkholderiales bacterium]|nr:LysR substrate-binding domain-containing protein [Burkholderiales bacterium]